MMKRRCFGLGALVLATLACPPARGEADFVSPGALQEAGLSKFWQLRLPLEPGQQLQDIHLVDNALYAGTQDGYVFAMDAYTGVIRWLQRITRSGYHVRRPCHAGENVVFVTPTDLQIYNRRTGDGVRRHELRFPPGTAVVSDGERLFIGGIDRRLYALNAETQFLEWRIITDGPIVSTPALYGEHVFVANDAGTVFACTRADKRQHWVQPAVTYGPIAADLVVDNRGVFVASKDLSLYLFFLENGLERWRVRFSAPLDTPPVVTTDLAFQYCEGAGVSAVETEQINTEAGIRWTVPAGRIALTVDKRCAYILSRDETLLAVKLADGEIAGTIPTPGFTIGIPDVVTTTVFIAAVDGRLFCARPRDAEPLSKKDLREALLPTRADEGAAAIDALTTQPVFRTPAPLEGGPRGAPLGGRSKLSKEFEQRARTE